MKTYSEKLKDPRWQKKRLEIFERDNWTCQNCGNTELTLNVHHRKYDKSKNIWEYADCNLLTLCEKCHAETSQNVTWLQEAYRELHHFTEFELSEIVGFLNILRNYTEGRNIKDTLNHLNDCVADFTKGK